jgi:hypothetical protein
MKKIYYEKKTSCLREDLAKVQRGYEKEKVLIRPFIDSIKVVCDIDMFCL